MSDENIRWREDTREIAYIVTKQGDEAIHWSAAQYSFERIEYAGEYCFLPWLRIKVAAGDNPLITEVPLTSVIRMDFLS